MKQKIENAKNSALMQSLAKINHSQIYIKQPLNHLSNKSSKVIMEQYSHMDRLAQAKLIP
jgi:hypothetical protein